MPTAWAYTQGYRDDGFGNAYQSTPALNRMGSAAYAEKDLISHKRCRKSAWRECMRFASSLSYVFARRAYSFQCDHQTLFLLLAYPCILGIQYPSVIPIPHLYLGATVADRSNAPTVDLADIHILIRLEALGVLIDDATRFSNLLLVHFNPMGAHEHPHFLIITDFALVGVCSFSSVVFNESRLVRLTQLGRIGSNSPLPRPVMVDCQYKKQSACQWLNGRRPRILTDP